MVYRQVVKYDFSVRKTEEIVRKLSGSEAEPTSKTAKDGTMTDQFSDLKKHLGKYFNSNIGLKINDQYKGKIEIPFNDSKDLDRIIGIFDRLNS